jgi:hypothetical protein
LEKEGFLNILGTRNNMSKKNKAWYKPLRHSYIPINIYGALTYIPYLAYLAYSIYAPLHYLDNLPLALLIAIPNWICATILITLFAKYKS